MSTMTKRIKNKITPKRPEEPKKDKVGKDYLLLALIGITAMILIMSISVLDAVGIAMYAMLLIGMISVYVPRHFPMSEERKKFVGYLSMASLAICIVLMIANFIIQYNK